MIEHEISLKVTLCCEFFESWIGIKHIRRDAKFKGLMFSSTGINSGIGNCGETFENARPSSTAEESCTSVIS